MKIVSRTWGVILQTDALLSDLIGISKKPAELNFESHPSTTKLTLGHLITLLASGDGILEMHVPVVNFESFGLNDSQFQAVVQAAERCNRARSRHGDL
jgi:hypothetical protein